jgi:hypothetical protein
VQTHTVFNADSKSQCQYLNSDKAEVHVSRMSYFHPYREKTGSHKVLLTDKNSEKRLARKAVCLHREIEMYNNNSLYHVLTCLQHLKFYIKNNMKMKGRRQYLKPYNLNITVISMNSLVHQILLFNSN